MFLGVDQSLTNTGFAVLDNEDDRPVYLSTAPTGRLRGAERLAFIRDELAFLSKKYSFTHSAIEGYSMESVNRAFDLGELGGVLRLYLHDAGVPYLIVPPTSLKKFVTGNGQATKLQMKAHTSMKWAQLIEQEDACDAYGLAQVARAYVKNSTTIRSELEVLETLKPKQASPSLVSRGRTKSSI